MRPEKPETGERAQPTAEQVAQDIRKVLEEHPEIFLHPGRTPEQWAELVIKTGGCPCVRGRKKCPCDELFEDMERLDHCRCCLYCNARYLKLYDEVVVQRRKAKARGSSPKGRGSITSRRGSPFSAPAVHRAIRREAL